MPLVNYGLDAAQKSDILRFFNPTRADVSIISSTVPRFIPELLLNLPPRTVTIFQYYLIVSITGAVSGANFGFPTIGTPITAFRCMMTIYDLFFYEHLTLAAPGSFSRTGAQLGITTTTISFIGAIETGVQGFSLPIFVTQNVSNPAAVIIRQGSFVQADSFRV